MKIKIKLNGFSLHLIWMMGLLEFITVPLVSAVNRLGSIAKNNVIIWNGFGFVVGGIGAYLVFFLINKISYWMKLKINNERVKKIKSLIGCMMWGGLILFLIFALQTFFTAYIAKVYYYDFMRLGLLGFFSTFPSILLTCLLYRYLIKYLNFLSINIITEQHEYKLIDISPFLVACLAGFYEAIAIPAMDLFELNPYKFSSTLLAGGLGGVTGGLFLVILYAMISRIVKVKLVFNKKIND